MKDNSTVKRLLCNEKRVPFYIFLAVLFVLYNIMGLPALFRSGGDLFDATDRLVLLTLFLLIGFLVLLSLTMPFRFRNVEGEETPPFWDRIHSQCIPYCLCVAVQALLVKFCSSKIHISILEIVIAAVAICALIYGWAFLCGCLYLLGGSVGWYFVGLFTLNIAPITISQGCYDIYNANPIAPHESWNPFNFYVFILLFGVFAAVFAVLLRKIKKIEKIVMTVFSNLYKIIMIFLVSLSIAFLFCKTSIEKGPVTLGLALAFTGTALVISSALVYFVFRNKKLILRIGVSTLAVVVFSALIFGFIPSSAQNKAFDLPKEEEVESVRIFLDSIETFEVDEHLGDCIAIHEDLLNLFEEGYMPDKTESAYKEPKCIADLWENANFHYQLKNGKSFSREYRRLKDPAFDEIYIKLMQSDMYAYSLKNVDLKKPRIETVGLYCELSENFVIDFLATYCEELKNADKSAFYERYDPIPFIGVYGSYKRIIYVPKSFTKTRTLLNEYVNEHKEK